MSSYRSDIISYFTSFFVVDEEPPSAAREGPISNHLHGSPPVGGAATCRRKPGGEVGADGTTTVTSRLRRDLGHLNDEGSTTATSRLLQGLGRLDNNGGFLTGTVETAGNGATRVAASVQSP